MAAIYMFARLSWDICLRVFEGYLFEVLDILTIKFSVEIPIRLECLRGFGDNCSFGDNSCFPVSFIIRYLYFAI
jgi:hypothetical protein